MKIFDRFIISIPSGTTIVIVGNNGSGKSTIVSLIEPFYDPTSDISSPSPIIGSFSDPSLTFWYKSMQSL
jgi:ABC-type lipoprotein export system ATPase subunit